MSSLPARSKGEGDREASARARRRLPVLFVLASLLLHLAAAGGALLLIRDLWAPRLEVTWLDLDNRLGAPQPQAGPLTPTPPLTAKPKPAVPPKAVAAGVHGTAVRHQAHSRDAGPGSKESVANAAATGGLGAEKIALADLAPGNAALILLLRMDRIRRSPYELAVRRLLEVFYDHKTILWGSALDLVNDFDALLIASPNPNRVTETFLAARSSRSAGELRRGLERAASFGKNRLRWIPAGDAMRGEIPSPPKLSQDPRALWVRGNMILLSEPNQLATLTLDGPPTDAGVPGPSWVSRLIGMADRGGPGSSSGPGLLLQAVNLSRLLALPTEVPVPQLAQIGIEAQDPSRVESVLTFASESVAKAFLVEAKRRIEQMRNSSDGTSRLLRWLGIADLLASVRFKRTQATVTATVQLSEPELNGLLEAARSAIPQVSVPGMPDRRPIDAGQPRPDAGPSARDVRTLH